MARSARAAALRAAAFIAALLARASPPPRDCCGDGSCALECTEGCAAAGCASCCCAGVTCPSTQYTDAGACSGAGACSTETNKAAGATCLITTAGDGMCDGAGACAPAAPAGSWATVSEGLAFGCGVDAVRRAWCWGTSDFGALGQGLPPAPGRRLLLQPPAYTPQTQLPLPALVVSAPPFASITAGFEHACALTPAGAAHCWGAPRRAPAARPPRAADSLPRAAGLNDAGQLDDGTQGDAGTPVAVLTAGAPAAWSKIAAGAKHTCAISADAARQPGSVWCWGEAARPLARPALAPPARVALTRRTRSRRRPALPRARRARRRVPAGQRRLRRRELAPRALPRARGRAALHRRRVRGRAGVRRRDRRRRRAGRAAAPDTGGGARTAREGAVVGKKNGWRRPTGPSA
jgi:hypothetical protein